MFKFMHSLKCPTCVHFNILINLSFCTAASPKVPYNSGISDIMYAPVEITSEFARFDEIMRQRAALVAAHTELEGEIKRAVKGTSPDYPGVHQ